LHPAIRDEARQQRSIDRAILFGKADFIEGAL
jgi:hypothetical protein